jgi:GT2 family glycosyltransferase/SAM-dependent methyltransferase
MVQSGADRNFSEGRHRCGNWHTTPVGSVNVLTNSGVRFCSFKHQELYRFAHRCSPWYTVVDFGCGSGAYSDYYLKIMPSVVIAVDWSFGALRSLPRCNPRCLPVCADLHALPFKPGCIDALFSIDTIGHLRNQSMALDEINRICRSGAPLFLHSECSDYRKRWPDSMLIRSLNRDAIAEIDGHFGIRPAAEMRGLFERRFAIAVFFSPAGLAGWLLGYPEKYTRVFRAAGSTFASLLTGVFATVKSIPVLKQLLRFTNACTNRLELAIGLTGGGSCFARGATRIPEPYRIGSALPAIDIIIPTLGRPQRIGAMVSDLLGQCRPEDRIIIVWQGDTKPHVPGDRRVGLLHQHVPNLPAARNNGLRTGGNPIVLFLDDDCDPEKGLLDAHRSCYTDPAIGAVAGFIDDPLFAADFPEPSSFNITNGEIRQNFHLDRSGYVGTLMGANMSFKRVALEAIRGFDTHYIHNALWEDVDASFRVQNAGYRVWYCANAKVRHVRCTTGGCRSDTSVPHLYYFFSNTAYFAGTYAPRAHVKKWLRFWWYHLEYFSRNKNGPAKPFRCKHNMLLVGAGLSGAITGGLRFLLTGSRKALPMEVIRKSDGAAGGTA